MTERGNRALRGRLLWFNDDPACGDEATHLYIEDGLILIENGLITRTGPAADLLDAVPEGCPIIDHRPHLIMPGFIDTHLHFPQTQVIASYGTELLDWLNTYTFVEEQRYEDKEVGAEAASFFVDELLRNGTTTAAIYCSVHPQSVDALFEEAQRRNARFIAGKVMMDRNAPAALTDTAEKGYEQSKNLIEKWHGMDRLSYAITPRFAVTSSDAQLEAAGALAAEFPECLIQTHLSENHIEIATISELFPWSEDYTHVYERYGLLGPKTLLGHCIHLSDRERRALSETGAVAVFCPTSNLFLGSGLFDWMGMRTGPSQIRTAMATDIGGGTSYSMLTTAAEGYKVLALQGQRMTPMEAFYVLTLGNARALGLEDMIGRLEPGHEADIVVLNSSATEAMAWRMKTVQSLKEELFVLMKMGDDRAIEATYLMGEEAHRKPTSQRQAG